MAYTLFPNYFENRRCERDTSRPETISKSTSKIVKTISTIFKSYILQNLCAACYYNFSEIYYYYVLHKYTG